MSNNNCFNPSGCNYLLACAGRQECKWNGKKWFPRDGADDARPFELVDQPLRLKYYAQGSVVDAGVARFDEEWYDAWLRHMMVDNDFIFFLTVATTDVFKNEWTKSQGL